MQIASIYDFRRAVRQGNVGGALIPVYFICEDGAALCRRCVKVERRNVLNSIANGRRDGWHVVALEINYKDPNCRCDHCGARIECAYRKE
jgi:hypothetical protein